MWSATQAKSNRITYEREKVKVSCQPGYKYAIRLYNVICDIGPCVAY